MKPMHTARGFTNISYIQSSAGYLYGRMKPCTVKRRQKPQKNCLYVTAVSRIGKNFVVKDMQQIFGEWKLRRTTPRQRYQHSTRINLEKTKQQRWERLWMFFQLLSRVTMGKNGVLSIISILKYLEIKQKNQIITAPAFLFLLLFWWWTNN